MHNIRIGGETAECLALTVHGRQFPDSADFWDGNWLTCDVEVAVGAFRGAFGRTVRNEELEQFRRQLEQLYERLTGDAALQTLEDWIDLQVRGDGRGHFAVNCRLCDDPVYGSTLE